MHSMKKYCRYFIAYVLWALYTFTIPVYASDAVSDIMNNERFQGAIENISWLTERVDYWFSVVISVTAFFIISAALLKNACAGAYCANHKFWDKVAEAHEKNEAISLANIKDFFIQKNFLNTTGGGIRDFLLGLVPNIKALTDFDDADIEPKQYFMKAIPQMLICVIIGVFIYNGYYRDTAAKVGQFGSEICERVFAAVDPSSFIDKLTQTAAKPDNIYENDTTLQGQDIYKLSSEIYTTFVSEAKDFTGSDQMTALMRDSEAKAYETLNKPEVTSVCYTDSRLYDFHISNISVTPCSPEAAVSATEKSGTMIRNNADTKNNSKYTFSYFCGCPETVKDYVGNNTMCRITFTMIGESKDNTQLGLTSITASAGSWASVQVDTITCYVVSQNTTKNDDGDVICSGTYDNLYGKVASDVEQRVSAYCESNNLGTHTTPELKAINSADSGGGGKNPNKTASIQFDEAAEGSVKSVTMRVRFQVNVNGTPKYETCLIPVDFVIKAQ